jgi:hypothetical protein
MHAQNQKLHVNQVLYPPCFRLSLQKSPILALRRAQINSPAVEKSKVVHGEVKFEHGQALLKGFRREGSSL